MSIVIDFKNINHSPKYPIGENLNGPHFLAKCSDGCWHEVCWFFSHLRGDRFKEHGSFVTKDFNSFNPVKEHVSEWSYLPGGQIVFDDSDPRVDENNFDIDTITIISSKYGEHRLCVYHDPNHHWLSHNQRWIKDLTLSIKEIHKKEPLDKSKDVHKTGFNWISLKRYIDLFYKHNS